MGIKQRWRTCHKSSIFLQICFIRGNPSKSHDKVCMLVVSTPLKNMSSSVGIMKFPTEWKVIKFMFQTTNQIMGILVMAIKIPFMGWWSSFNIGKQLMFWRDSARAVHRLTSSLPEGGGVWTTKGVDQKSVQRGSTQANCKSSKLSQRQSKLINGRTVVTTVTGLLFVSAGNDPLPDLMSLCNGQFLQWPNIERHRGSEQIQRKVERVGPTQAGDIGKDGLAGLRRVWQARPARKTSKFTRKTEMTEWWALLGGEHGNDIDQGNRFDGQNGLLERKINPGSSTGRRRQQESFLRIVIPKDCISFLTTGFDWGIHITKQDETEKHFMPRSAPIVFAAVIFGNIWGPSTRSKPRHHSSCVIGALQNTLKVSWSTSSSWKQGVWYNSMGQTPSRNQGHPGP